MPSSTPSTAALHIVCLCAEWCGTCRDYRGVFDALARAHPQWGWRWIDIEDEADLAGDVDIETFPTLLVVLDGRLLFAGPVLPRAPEALRLIESVRADPDRHARLLREHLDDAQWAALSALVERL
jgi:thiol-disulfide isomerase/thioredoxin